jgi:predicted enzyme related to lactoylglutathione lyase
MDNESDNYKFDYSKIVVNVSSSKEAESYFQNILGFKAIKNEKGSFDYKMGKTIIGINELKNSEKKYVGMPHEILGMSLIQFVVKDIPFSRNKILKRGGKIFIEPYNIGNLAVIMFTQGPDGILFEFGAAL